MTNCKFICNSATTSSGAVSGGSYYDCLFEGNSAKVNFGVGAGFSAFNCSFIGNTTDGEGGAIRLLNNIQFQIVYLVLIPLEYLAVQLSFPIITIQRFIPVYSLIIAL